MTENRNLSSAALKPTKPPPGPRIDEAKRILVKLVDLIDNQEFGEGGATVGDMRMFANYAEEALAALNA